MAQISDMILKLKGHARQKYFIFNFQQKISQQGDGPIKIFFKFNLVIFCKLDHFITARYFYIALKWSSLQKRVGNYFL